MPKCGVCGWSFSDRTLMKHAYTPCGEDSQKAPMRGSPEFDDLASQLQDKRAITPEVDDIIKQLDEEQGND